MTVKRRSKVSGFLKPQHLRYAGEPHLRQDLLDRFDMGIHLRVAYIDEMYEHVRVEHFFYGGAEGLLEFLRHVPYESDRVGYDRVALSRKAKAPRGGVERCEEFIFG